MNIEVLTRADNSAQALALDGDVGQPTVLEMWSGG
jgi:hypothetical protein